MADSENVYAIYHVITPKIDLAGFISPRHNKTRQVNFWNSDMVYSIHIFWQSAIFLPAIIFTRHNITRYN